MRLGITLKRTYGSVLAIMSLIVVAVVYLPATDIHGRTSTAYVPDTIVVTPRMPTPLSENEQAAKAALELGLSKRASDMAMGEFYGLTPEVPALAEPRKVATVFVSSTGVLRAGPTVYIPPNLLLEYILVGEGAEANDKALIELSTAASGMRQFGLGGLPPPK